MDKALSPYVKGGGAKQYEDELKRMYGMDGSMDGAVGGFQAMTQDMLTVLNDIPFSIPAYFALLARAVVTLEGLALTGDPSYGLIIEAYPFVARKLLSEGRPELQQALQQVLYSGGDARGVVTPTRLAALLNSAAGVVAKQDGAVFVDLDAVPEEGISPKEAAVYILSPKAESLRKLLTQEAVTGGDLLLRQALRKNAATLAGALPQPPSIPLIGSPLQQFAARPYDGRGPVAPAHRRRRAAPPLGDAAAGARRRGAQVVARGGAVCPLARRPRALLPRRRCRRRRQRRTRLLASLAAPPRPLHPRQGRAHAGERDGLGRGARRQRRRPQPGHACPDCPGGEAAAIALAGTERRTFRLRGGRRVELEL